MPAAAKTSTSPLSPIELETIVSLPEAAELMGQSEDLIKRNPDHARHIIKLGKRRLGMRVKHALLLAR